MSMLGAAIAHVPLPTCARCHQPVERMETNRDFLAARTEFHVWCHGEHRAYPVDDEFLAAYVGKLGMAEVFEDQPALPSAQRALPEPSP